MEASYGNIVVIAAELVGPFVRGRPGGRFHVGSGSTVFAESAFLPVFLISSTKGYIATILLHNKTT